MFIAFACLLLVTVYFLINKYGNAIEKTESHYENVVLKDVQNIDGADDNSVIEIITDNLQSKMKESLTKLPGTVVSIVFFLISLVIINLVPGKLGALKPVTNVNKSK